MHVGDISPVKNSKGEIGRWAPVILADMSMAIKCMFDESVVATAKTAFVRERVAV